jgi:hypothetical protein
VSYAKRRVGHPGSAGDMMGEVDSRADAVRRLAKRAEAAPCSPDPGRAANARTVARRFGSDRRRLKKVKGFGPSPWAGLVWLPPQEQAFDELVGLDQRCRRLRSSAPM